MPNTLKIAKKYKTFANVNELDLVAGIARFEGELANKAGIQAVLNGYFTSLPQKTVRIITNIQDALKFIFGKPYKVDGEVKTPFDEEYILKLHEILALGVADYDKEKLYVGQFRDFKVQIEGVNYTPPVRTKRDASLRMDMLLNSINREDIDLEHILEVYATLCKEQFFANTNKRTATVWLLATLAYLNTGYQIFIPTDKFDHDLFIWNLTQFYEKSHHLSALLNFIEQELLYEVED